VGAESDGESIGFSTKNNEMFLTSNQDEYSYPFSITSDNNNI
jgi:hypothetical protein